MTAVTAQVEAPAGAPAQDENSQREPQHEAVTANSLSRILLSVWRLVLEHWFILGVGVAIGLAAAVPDFGKNDG